MGALCIVKDEASRCKCLPYRAALRKCSKKGFCYLRPPWDSCLLLHCWKATLWQWQNLIKKKKKNRFNSPQFSDAYCAQKPLKQLRMQDCHLPCCFYRSCRLMSFTKKRNDNQEGFRALLRSSRSGTLFHFFSVSVFGTLMLWKYAANATLRCSGSRVERADKQKSMVLVWWMTLSSYQ